MPKSWTAFMMSAPFLFVCLASTFSIIACDILKCEALWDQKLTYKCQLLGEMGHECPKE